MPREPAASPDPHPLAPRGALERPRDARRSRRTAAFAPPPGHRIGDRSLSLLLALICASLVPPTLDGGVAPASLLLHALLFGGFVAASAALARSGWSARAASLDPNTDGRAAHRFAAALHVALVCAVCWIVYGTLADVAFVAVPWRADAALAAFDHALFGNLPQRLSVELTATRFGTELLSFAYAAFIPWLMLSVARRASDGPSLATLRFVVALSLLYAAGFAGYLLAPAEGPITTLASAYPGAIDGGFFHALVVDGVERAGGPHGAFPSLHVGITVLILLADLAERRFARAATGCLLVGAIATATVALRYHYVVDIAAGAVLAASAFGVARHVTRRRGGDGAAGASDVVDPSGELASGTIDDASTAAQRPGSSYRLVRWILSLSLHGYYRVRVDDSRSRSPEHGPLLIVSNHVNGLVDPLPVIASLERRVTLTAKRALAASMPHRLLLRTLGAVLLERREDDVPSADEASTRERPVSGTPSPDTRRRDRNARALDTLRDVLRHGGAVHLFPEGRSRPDGAAQPFRDGAARLALDAVIGRADLRVLPVHVDFPDKTRWRSRCTLRVGTPLDVRAWIDARGAASATSIPWATDPATDPVTALTAELQRRVRALSLGSAGTGADGPARIPRRDGGGSRLARTIARIELLVAGLPLGLWGALHAALPLAVVAALRGRLGKDADHRAAAAILVAPIVFGAAFLMTAAIALAALPPVWAALYLVSIVAGVVNALDVVDVPSAD